MASDSTQSLLSFWICALGLLALVHMCVCLLVYTHTHTHTHLPQRLLSLRNDLSRKPPSSWVSSSNQRLYWALMFWRAPRKRGWGFRSLTPTHQQVSGPQPPSRKHCGLQQPVEIKAFHQKPGVIGPHEVVQEDLGGAAGGGDLQRRAPGGESRLSRVWTQKVGEGLPTHNPPSHSPLSQTLVDRLREAATLPNCEGVLHVGFITSSLTL